MFAAILNCPATTQPANIKKAVSLQERELLHDTQLCMGGRAMYRPFLLVLVATNLYYYTNKLCEWLVTKIGFLRNESQTMMTFKV